MLLTEYDEQAHIANEKKWSYEDGFEDGKEIGEKIGEKIGRQNERQKNIIIFIKDKLDDDIKEEIIIEKLKVRFYLTKEEAEKCIAEAKRMK